MGYRSDVAILMYGEPSDCDIVCNLFLGSGVSQELKDLFEKYKREAIDDGEKYVLWRFYDIKWYSDCDSAKDKLFEFVNAIEEERKEGTTPLAIEYARLGESDDDNERECTDQDQWLLQIERRFNYPEFLQTNEGE